MACFSSSPCSAFLTQRMQITHIVQEITLSRVVRVRKHAIWHMPNKSVSHFSETAGQAVKRRKTPSLKDAKLQPNACFGCTKAPDVSNAGRFVGMGESLLSLSEQAHLFSKINLSHLFHSQSLAITGNEPKSNKSLFSFFHFCKRKE